ncbi:MAG: class I SAM-dependent methyltransferase [Planctomycetota bacterium]|nr:MAG: class I SAM-dependent methyltransferase [Planctomycetota bacterium]REK23487.1 MAG: class I SAM-dependent methyltransferase [Planctomycetota bacterium]REK38988.1 MAG: class I SAM-dependent methyltransferase [Planctomycetota bacterium]
MLPRTLEPEVMDTAEEAKDYDAMDHSAVNRKFVDELLAEWSPNRSCRSRILDVGTGTAQIPIELARQQPALQITAIDLAEEMLKLGERNVASAGLGGVIMLERIDAKSMPYDDAAFDVVMSNSIVHHIPEPWTVFREMLRVLKPGGLLFVRDLLRPESTEEIERLVKTYAGDENAHQQQLFRQSFHAALTVEEMRELIGAAGLRRESVQQTSDRHWTVCARVD